MISVTWTTPATLGAVCSASETSEDEKGVHEATMPAAFGALVCGNKIQGVWPPILGDKTVSRH